MLAAAVQAGGLKAVNLFGNSRVEVVGSDNAQQQQEQQQQQQQGEVVCIRVEPRPVGGHQGRPCCMLDVVLLLQDKGAYQEG
jgi:predicted phage tail protein